MQKNNLFSGYTKRIMGKEIFVFMRRAVSNGMAYIRNHPDVCLWIFCVLIVVLSVCVCNALQRTMSAWKEKIRLKKALKEQAKRTLQFTLPDKENAFIRERLQQALNTTDAENTQKAQTCFEFLYAQKLLVKISEKALNTPERLEILEMQKFFSAHLQQPTWNVNDVRAVNDCFSRILKLSAKYEVELPV